MTSAGDFEEVPEVEGGTPRDISDAVKARNTQKGMTYRDKWGTLRYCILEFNERIEKQ